MNFFSLSKLITLIPALLYNWVNRSKQITNSTSEEPLHCYMITVNNYKGKFSNKQEKKNKRFIVSDWSLIIYKRTSYLIQNVNWFPTLLWSRKNFLAFLNPCISKLWRDVFFYFFFFLNLSFSNQIKNALKENLTVL